MQEKIIERKNKTFLRKQYSGVSIRYDPMRYSCCRPDGGRFREWDALIGRGEGVRGINYETKQEERRKSYIYIYI